MEKINILTHKQHKENHRTTPDEVFWAGEFPPPIFIKSRCYDSRAIREIERCRCILPKIDERIDKMNDIEGKFSIGQVGKGYVISVEAEGITKQDVVESCLNVTANIARLIDKIYYEMEEKEIIGKEIKRHKEAIEKLEK